jgi:hypothetical protein
VSLFLFTFSSPLVPTATHRRAVPRASIPSPALQQPLPWRHTLATSLCHLARPCRFVARRLLLPQCRTTRRLAPPHRSLYSTTMPSPTLQQACHQHHRSRQHHLSFTARASTTICPRTFALPLTTSTTARPWCRHRSATAPSCAPYNWFRQESRAAHGVVGTCLSGHLDPMGNGERGFVALTRGVKATTFLSAVWHSMGVFIGNRGTARPCQGHLGPQLPSLSPEYSLTGGGGVTVSHYDILYYRHNLTHSAHTTSEGEALQHGSNCTRAPPCAEGDKALWSSGGLRLGLSERRGAHRPPYGWCLQPVWQGLQERPSFCAVPR